MKSAIFVLLLFLCATSLFAQAPVSAWAELDTDAGGMSTPMVNLASVSEAIRATSVHLDGKQFTFALRSAASYTKKGIRYSVAVSLTNAKRYNFTDTQTGFIADQESLTFSIPINGTTYKAIVHLEKK